MTDEAIAEAAQAGTSEVANAAAANNGSQVAAPTDFLAGLQNAESRQWVESKGFKALDPLVESARHADKVQSEFNEFKAKALTPPAPDAPQEQWDSFYSKLGRPEKAEGYEFKLPEGLPEDLPYDSNAASAAKNWAHKYGLTPKQAQGMHDEFARYQAGQWQQHIAAQDKRANDATDALSKVWGAKESETFKQNQQFADRFISQNGGNELLAEMKANGTIDANGFILSPLTANAFAKAGKALYSEDRFVVGGQASQPQSAAEILYPPGRDPFKT